MVVYNTRLVDGEFTKGRINNLMIEGEKIKTYAGEMSNGSVRRIKESCELMFAISVKKWYNHPLTGKRLSFRIGFLTTTLSAPQGMITDRELKKGLLEPFLRKLKKYGLRNYIWKAERQRNGNLHFHIFVDCFLDITDTRNIWNRLQAKYHFISDFGKKHGHHDPNSTDIKPVQTQEGMTQYMIKYMLKPTKKGEQLEIGREIDNKNTGKCWDCSKPLKERNCTAEFCEAGEYELIDQGVRDGELKEIKTDYCWIYIFSGENYRDYVPPSVELRYSNWIANVREMSS
jgi:hypothetical protein